MLFQLTVPTVQLGQGTFILIPLKSSAYLKIC